MRIKLPTFTTEFQPVEFSIPTSILGDGNVVSIGDEIAYPAVRRPQVTHMVATLPRALSGQMVEASVVPNPNRVVRPGGSMRPFSVNLSGFEEIHIADNGWGTIPRYDIGAVMIDRSRSLYANTDLSTYEHRIDGFMLAVDLGYMRKPNTPWRKAAEELVLSVQVESPTEPKYRIDSEGSALIRSVDVSSVGGDKWYVIFRFHSLTLVHASRVALQIAFSLDGMLSPDVSTRVGIMEGWLDEHDFLSSMRAPGVLNGISRPSSIGLAIQNYDQEDRSNFFRTRRLEGNQYSAAPGSNWMNMGRRHIAPALAGGVDGDSVRYLDILRSGAIGLSLLRIHNVVEDDGSPVLFANHDQLRTDRQIPHFSSGDFLLAGAVPPAGQPSTTNPNPEALGIDRRNARDGEHYEIGVVDDYLALVIDPAIERSRRAMLNMDFGRTKIWNSWSATSRDAGREISQACDAFYLFADLQAFLGLYIDQWIFNTVRDSLTVRDYFTSIFSGLYQNDYLPARIHSTKNGVRWVAPYEEALLAGAMFKASKLPPFVRNAPLAAYFARLLATSCIHSFQPQDGEIWTVTYLTEYRGNGERPTMFSVGGSEYINFCIQAARVASASPPLYQRSPDVEQKFGEILSWFTSQRLNTEEAIRWYFV